MRKGKIHMFIVSLFLLTGTLVLGCSGSKSPASQSGAKVETTSVTIGSARDPQLASEIIIAKEQGFFKEEGLDVKLQLFQSGSDLTTAIAGKSILVGSAGDSPSTILKASGNKIKVIAQQSDISGAQALVVKPEIKHPKDLNGKRVAFSPGNTSESLFLKIVNKYELDPNSMKIFKMGPSEMLAAFQKGDIDALVVWEPTVLNAVKFGGFKLLSASDSFIPGEEGKQKLLGAHSLLIANEEFLASNPETTKAILRSLDKAVKFILNSPDKAAEMVAKMLDIDKGDAKTMIGLNVYSLSITPELINDIKGTAEFLKSKGTINNIPDYSSFVDPSFLKTIEPNLVTWNP